MRARVPYAGTTIPPEKTQGEIQALLYAHGAEGVQWTLVGDRMTLKFLARMGNHVIAIRIEPPLLLVPKRTAGRRGPVERFTDRAASMRLLKWWLKSKLEAVEYGLVSFEEEFLAHVSGRLASGEEVTVGQVVIPRLASMPPDELARALPEKS